MTLRPLLALVLAAAPVSAGTVYDGSLGTSPNSQQFFYLTDPFGGASAVQTVGSSSVTLNTTAQTSDKAGYFGSGSTHAGIPEMDRATGFTVSFTLRLDSETHNTSDRAGLSVIALGSDSRGIELGFWTDRIWAQSDSPLFTHAEEALFDPTASLIAYDLAIVGDSYTLSSGATTILTGSVRDYTAFSGAFNPYDQQNFVFVGDDTGSAAASFEMTHVVVTVPEPTSGMLVLLGGALFGLGRRRLRA
jgi:hypothetical protein